VGGFLALQGLLHGRYGGTPRGRGQDELRRSGLTDRNREHLKQIVRAVGSLDSDHETVTGYRVSPADVHHWHALTGEDIVERMLRGESTATRNNGDRRWSKLSIEDDPEPAAHGYPEDRAPMDGNAPPWKVGKKEG
jgi:hypothetical protein